MKPEIGVVKGREINTSPYSGYISFDVNHSVALKNKVRENTSVGSP